MGLWVRGLRPQPHPLHQDTLTASRQSPGHGPSMVLHWKEEGGLEVVCACVWGGGGRSGWMSTSGCCVWYLCVVCLCVGKGVCVFLVSLWVWVWVFTV